MLLSDSTVCTLFFFELPNSHIAPPIAAHIAGHIANVRIAGISSQHWVVCSKHKVDSCYGCDTNSRNNRDPFFGWFCHTQLSILKLARLRPIHTILKFFTIVKLCIKISSVLSKKYVWTSKTL